MFYDPKFPPVPPRPPKRSGFLKLLVLKTLEEGPAHGYEIMKNLEKVLSWHPLNPGVLYRILNDLKDKGLIKVIKEAERGKKVYMITEKGREYLNSKKDQLNRILNKIGNVRKFLSMGGNDLLGIIFLLVEKANELNKEQEEHIKAKISKFVQEIWDIIESRGDDGG